MQIITMGKNIPIPKVELPNVIVGCNNCNSVYNINLNKDCQKKYRQKDNIFLWQFICLNCGKEIVIGVPCKSKDKALAYAMARGNRWVK